MRSLWPPRSLSVKLGLTLFAIVAAALAIVYVAVVPRLENKLVNATYDALSRSVPTISAVMRGTPQTSWQRIATSFDHSLNARVAIFGRLEGNTFLNLADSFGTPDDLQGDPILHAAIANGRTARGRVERDGREFAEVAAHAVGVGGAYVLIAAPVGDPLSAVTVVRRDLLIFGGVALAASWLLGALLALKFTSRLRRLEDAAERIADGDFEVQIIDTGHDEVAELAHTFDRMRLRLARLDRARREFIANASHELRTPLFALGGFLELLDDEEMDETTRRDFLETARGQVDRLTRLASDLLDLSRLDADELGVASDPVDLAAVASELAAEFGPVAEASGHLLRADPAAEVLALGDEERVLRIGRALVENALRHTPAGTEVEITTAVWLDRAELCVRDTGPGVRPEDQQRVFDRFFRAEGSTAFGSGIGLAIARELAERMGGGLELRSEPGDTRFVLVLPRPKAPAFPRENAVAV